VTNLPVHPVEMPSLVLNLPDGETHTFPSADEAMAWVAENLDDEDQQIAALSLLETVQLPDEELP
jgi:hypothetical protein